MCSKLRGLRRRTRQRHSPSGAGVAAGGVGGSPVGDPPTWRGAGYPFVPRVAMSVAAMWPKTMAEPMGTPGPG